MHTKQGFSLIELMVVITIIWIISVSVIIPYNFYANISKVKLSVETINQSLNETRNSAAWLVDWVTSKNQNTALVFVKWATTINFVGIPVGYSGSIFNYNSNVLRNILLDDNVYITNITSLDWSNNDLNKAVLLYNAPNWDKSILTDNTHTWSYLKITIWYKKAKNWTLSREIIIK